MTKNSICRFIKVTQLSSIIFNQMIFHNYIHFSKLWRKSPDMKDSRFIGNPKKDFVLARPAQGRWFDTLDDILHLYEAPAHVQLRC
mmetsp:Transcript_33896/g.63250  ORF Transcript_33896/g.63250 Transcript_33896/m.63250 type:complete len:86 (-) Transcript_33896:53-310(-)